MKLLALLSALVGPALAIPESYEARLHHGTCNAFGSPMQSGTGWGFLPDLRISPSHTGTAADEGLSPSMELHQQVRMSPYEYVVFRNMTGIARGRIDCTDERSLHWPFVDDPDLRVFTSQPRQTRLVAGLGLMAEGYKILVDGEEIEGGYLGLGGIVKWGFKEVEREDGVVVWEARLMVPGAVEGDVEGEVYGFLRAGRWGTFE